MEVPSIANVKKRFCSVFLLIFVVLSCSLGFLLDKKVGTNQPTRIENAKILIANTPMDADKIKVFGSRVRVDSVAKVAELELAEKVCTFIIHFMV